VGLVIRGPISEAQEPKNDHRKDAQGQNQRSDQALAGRFVQEESRCGVPWHSFEMYQKIRSQIKLEWGDLDHSIGPVFSHVFPQDNLCCSENSGSIHLAWI
jgi:hypothetical protein